MSIEELKCINENINIDEYLKFTEQVKKAMKNTEWFATYDKEELIEELKNKSKIWIYYNNEEPVCSMMFLPSTKESITKLGLNDYDYKLVADYGPIMVNIKYIGNKLQYQMLKKLDEYSLKQGYRYAVATVHPNNNYSSNNFIKDGFKEVETKQLSWGLRNIYFKTLIKEDL